MCRADAEAGSGDREWEAMLIRLAWKIPGTWLVSEAMGPLGEMSVSSRPSKNMSKDFVTNDSCIRIVRLDLAGKMEVPSRL